MKKGLRPDAPTSVILDGEIVVWVREQAEKQDRSITSVVRLIIREKMEQPK